MLKIDFFWSILISVNLRRYQLDRTDVSAIHQLKIADIWQYFSIIFRKNQAKEWTLFYRFRTCTLSELPLPLVSWLCECDSSTATKISNKDDVKTIGIDVVRDSLCIKPRRCLPWQHNVISKHQTPLNKRTVGVHSQVREHGCIVVEHHLHIFQPIFFILT